VDGPRNLPPSVAVDADRDDHRHRNDAAGLAHFDVGGVNPQIQPARPRSVGPKAISVGRKLLYQVDGRVELALQLPTCFEVRPLSGGLVSSAPERPCDDVCGLDPLSSEPDGDAPNFLD